jgi:transposase-like protein
VKYLLFDATYLHHSGCLMCLLDARTQRIFQIDYASRENYASAYGLFKGLQEQGLNPISITLDGHTAVLKAASDVWPEVVIQRCIVHVQRQGLSWLRRRPKLECARQLRSLLLSLTAILTRKEKRSFIKQFNLWLEKYGEEVDNLPKKDKIYSDLQRTRSLLIHGIPFMFHYLDNPLIPASTNMLEGLFSRVKEHYRRHRGLRVENRLRYFSWYSYLYNLNLPVLPTNL